MITLSSPSPFRHRRLGGNKWTYVRLLSSLHPPVSCCLLPPWPLSFVALLLSLPLTQHFPPLTSVPPTHSRLYATTPNTLYMFLVLTPSSSHLSPFDVRLRQHTDDTDVTHVHIPSFMTPSFIPILNTSTFSIHREFRGIAFFSLRGLWYGN